MDSYEHSAECRIFLNMEHPGNPCKKLRLDGSNINNCPSFGDDLWGQDDITAEEFDMLETQATQSHRKEDTFLHPVNARNCYKLHDNSELESMKQTQYELEGRIKLLTQNIEKSKKELHEERISKEKILTDKAKEFEQREKNLLKEIEKMKSALQFKEQETKSIYSKVHRFEDQLKLKEKNEVSEIKNMERNNRRFESNNLIFDVPQRKHQAQRKWKLIQDTPLGKTKGTDVISSLLCNKMPVFEVQKPFKPFVKPASEGFLSNNSELTTISVVKLSFEKKTEELFEYYDSLLKKHLEYLNTLSSKSPVTNCNQNSPLSSRQKEVQYKKVSIMSCLKDICSLFTSWSTTNKRKTEEASNEVNMILGPSNLCIPILENKVEAADSLPLLWTHLVALTNPKIYPNRYSKLEEIECALLALLTCSYSSPQKLLSHICELPFKSLLNVQFSIPCICLTLKIIINCVHHIEFFKILIHKADDCLMCTVSTLLLQFISTSFQEYTVPLTLVLDFFSAVFSDSNFSELKPESSPCTAEVIRGVIQCLWKYFSIEEKDAKTKIALKKGLFLIYLLSNCVPNFKEKRSSVEDNYVLLVCGALNLSKEDLEFKDFYDIAHSLWDFQEDISEFDLDEQNDESSQLDSDTHQMDEL